jgi:ATP-dependent helicase/nuclease subunit A
MIADRAQRARALDPACSFIVQAPAGSGKTTLLVDRYLRLLAGVKKPEEILAITFTRKAAAEMRKRVIDKLPGAAEVAHRLRILTIDAFCASLTRQVPVLARFGAQPGIVEDASALHLEAAFEVLTHLENEPVQKLLSHLDNDVAAAAKLLASLLARREQWLRNAGRPPSRNDLEAAFGFERDRLLARANALQRGASAALAADVLTKKFTWRVKSKTAQVLASRPDAEEVRLALAPLLALPPDRYSDAQWEALEAILALLLPAVKELFKMFARNNRVDFAQIAEGAVRALGAADDPSELLLSLDQKISHVLVDEFQDTSQSQWQLLSLLTSGWQPGDGRTVFLVGDPMQSIYRFREAEVGLFLRARREGLGGVALEPLTLTTNFRSQSGLVSWFNAIFPRVLPAAEEETSGAVPYSRSTPHHAALPGAAAAWHGFFDRESEARQVVELVREATGKVAILVRNRSHLDRIVPALKAEGIRYRAVDIDALGEKQIVQDLYALARALTHPADRVAWLAILRAPWVGMSLSEFSKYFESKTGTVWELVQQVPGLERFRSVLGPALANRLRGTLRDRVEGAWLALGGPACVDDATDLEDAGIFLDELEKLEEAGGLPDSAALADKLEKLWALPDVDAGRGAVEIMTIHKAKGLEFDTVIVPGLDRPPRSGERELFLSRALPGGRLLLAPINETGGDKEPLYEYVRELDREAEDIEAGRLFYVAATRAVSRLHLLGCARPNEKGQAKPPNKRTLLAKAWFEAGQCFPSFALNPEPEPGVPVPSALLRRLPASFKFPPPPAPAQWSAPPEWHEDEERLSFDWARATARLAGVVAHGWFQRIAEDELRGWDAAHVDRLKPRIVRELDRLGVPPAAIERATGIVVTALKNALADERGRWLLGPHPRARNEYRLRSPGRSFRVDRYLEDAQGVKWVVDYKTSEHEGGGIDAFLDAERERYRAQLDAYSDALGRARRALYFPLLKGWREW